MEYRSLGRTGVQVSELCLGCVMFGGRTEDLDAGAIIDRAIDAGINFLDTANVYNRGESEQAVGRALQRNGKRDRIVLATKVHGTMDDDDPNGHGSHRRHIIKQCEDSLRRLQTDWIDLYQIHRPMSAIPIDETLQALDNLGSIEAKLTDGDRARLDAAAPPGRMVVNYYDADFGPHKYR